MPGFFQKDATKSPGSRAAGVAAAVAGVEPGAITVWSTPRRMALIARDLPEATQAVREETKGPAVGAPAQALDGFGVVG